MPPDHAPPPPHESPDVARAAARSPIDPGRRRWALGTLAAAAATLPAARPARAQAAAFPTRPITLVVPFPPGSASDIPVRALSAAAAKKLGQSIVIENKPGVSGTLGPVGVAKNAAPDGYTVAIAPASLWRLPHQQKVNYDPIQDFTYIAGLAAYTFAVAVNADAPWQTLGEMLAWGKANPGKLSLGGTGTGASGHIAAFKLAKLSGADINFVPFKGGAEISAAMLGGHIAGQTDAGWTPLVETGKARLLAVFTDKRLAKYPKVPTAKEAGYDIVVDSPWGLVGPKGMDPKIVATLEQAFLGSRDDPAYRKALDTFDLRDLNLGSAAFTRVAEQTYAAEKHNLQELNIKQN
ncbi:MAG: tripartite tricarboxylate transporter substrate binding protein [Burkholderiaceae bacterium]